MTQDDERELRRLYASGATDAELGDALGVSQRTIKRERARLDLPRRATPSPVVSDGALRALHAEGLVNAEIARRLGLTHRTVQERMSRLGLKSHRTGLAGRPKGRSPDARTERVIAYVTPAELAVVDERARLHGLERAAFARLALGLTEAS